MSTPTPEQQADAVLSKANDDGLIDLDALRAARREKVSKGPVVKMGGETFELPVELSWDAMTRIGPALQGDPVGIDAFMAEVFGEDAWNGDAFADLTLDDVLELIQRLGNAYGLAELGNLAASSPSSNRATRRSRPTSPSTTT